MGTESGHRPVDDTVNDESEDFAPKTPETPKSSETPVPVDPTEPSEPTEPVSTAWMWNFALAWFGFWLLIMLPGQFMLAKLGEHVSEAHKVGLTSFMVGEMAVVILLSVPVFGVLCDRTHNTFGRRRTWALGGFILAALSFSLVGTQTSMWTIAPLIAGVSFGEAAVLVALSAMIADQVPRLQRGRASAAMGVPQVIALTIGMVLVTMLVTSIPGSWLLIGLIALISPLPFLLRFGEPPPPPANAQVLENIRYAISLPSLRGQSDYYWAMASRVLINAGNLVGTTYLLYFLGDVVGRKNPDTSLLILTLIYLVASALSTYVGGVLSDRWKRRRVFVAVAGSLQAAAALLLAIAPSWESSIIGGVLLGLGYGAFLSVDQALVTDLLPDPYTRGRDLGIINSAQHIPIAPLIGWLVLSFAGYQSLYLVAAVIMAFGALSVYRIRSVR